MTIPLFIDDNIYLHHINLADLNHCYNFLAGGNGYATPASVDIDLLIEGNADFQRIDECRKQQKFYSVTEEELKTGLGSMSGISCSYRMQCLISASKFRNGKKLANVTWLVYHRLVLKMVAGRLNYQ
jgi:hypothetical protein